jgi:hypothetical protein
MKIGVQIWTIQILARKILNFEWQALKLKQFDKFKGK